MRGCSAYKHDEHLCRYIDTEVSVVLLSSPLCCESLESIVLEENRQNEFDIIEFSDEYIVEVVEIPSMRAKTDPIWF